MIYLAIFLPIWAILAVALFFVLNKKWSKKNHIALNIFYAITLLIPYPLEMLVFFFIRSKYNKATRKVFVSLNKAGFKYHAVFGTFLFAFRDKNFMDTDIDICVYRDEFTKEQEEIVHKLGFKLVEQWSLDNQIAEQSYVSKNGKLHMDIFHIGRGEEFAPTFDEKNNRYARRPRAYKYELAEYEVDGVKFLGPKDGEEYLKWNYGVWEKRDPNYHWLYGSSTHPTIVVENANIEYKKFD